MVRSRSAVQIRPLAPNSQRSSVVERFLGKKEAGSPILPAGSVIKLASLFLILYSKFMAQSKLKEQMIRLRCEPCKRINYYGRKNKKTVERKIELQKFCKWCRKHTTHKEARK